MRYAEALNLIGGLSKPSKMPWWSWSISAELCITGSKLHEQEGTVCTDCYALKGNYRFINVKEAHARRLAALDHPDFVDAFALVLTELQAKSRKGENRFRWLDSGDLQSVEMLEKIVEIACRTPQVRHWLPTRELPIVRRYLADGGRFPPNLVVRVSTALVGVEPREQPFDLPYSTVDVDSEFVKQCPALALQGNKCLDCDTCWSRQNVNYPLH